MADKISPPSSPGSSPGYDPSRKPPLSISTSRPEWTGTDQSQSSAGSASSFAQPPSFHNGPLSPPSSPYPVPLRSATTPASVGHKALRFASIGGTSSSTSGGKARPAESRRKSGSDVTTAAAAAGGSKRRASGEQKNNVYTRSGRHGDEWLFGGWSDAVKKMLWENNQKDE